MLNEFNKFIKNYKKDEGIILKEKHSIRVAKISKEIATNLKWPEEDIILAEKIGYLHDIGRFDEWNYYKTYRNNKFDHAKHGVNLLKNKDLKSNFNIKEKDKEIIYEAIYYHNKYKVPTKLNKFSKLIRDADKIDILYLHSKGKIRRTKQGEEISKKVKKEFFKEKSINQKNVLTKNDSTLLTLAFIFDINYDYSLKIIKEQKLLDNLYKKVGNKNNDLYFEYINKYIEKRINNVR